MNSPGYKDTPSNPLHITPAFALHRVRQPSFRVLHATRLTFDALSVGPSSVAAAAAAEAGAAAAG
jgi:hypothetical protein